MEKLNRAQKCSILGPQNLGSRGGPGPRAPPLDPHLVYSQICTRAAPQTVWEGYRTVRPLPPPPMKTSHSQLRLQI